MIECVEGVPCQQNITAPPNHFVRLNFTQLSGLEFSQLDVNSSLYPLSAACNGPRIEVSMALVVSCHSRNSIAILSRCQSKAFLMRNLSLGNNPKDWMGCIFKCRHHASHTVIKLPGQTSFTRLRTCKFILYLNPCTCFGYNHDNKLCKIGTIGRMALLDLVVRSPLLWEESLFRCSLEELYYSVWLWH